MPVQVQRSNRSLCHKLGLSLLVLTGTGALMAIGLFAGPGMTARIDTNTRPLVLRVSGVLPRLDAGIPGETTSSSLTVSNSGKEAGMLRFDLDAQGSAAALAQYELRVRSHGQLLHHGQLGARLALPLGLIAVNGTRTLRLIITLDRSARLQGARVRLAARFDASQR